MYDMGKVTYQTIFFNFYHCTLRGIEICVTLRIFNKVMAAVQSHESTWGLQPRLTE